MTQALAISQLRKPATLLEDWELRRSRLVAFKPPIDSKLIDAQLCLLGLLIDRHSAGSEALNPARFPLPPLPIIESVLEAKTGVLFVNRRAMIMHHHFRHAGRAASAEGEIGQRMGPLVRRLAARRPRPVRALYNEAAARNMDCIPIYRELRIGSSLLWNALREYILWAGETANGYVTARFAPRVGPPMNDETIAYLSVCAERPSGSAWLAVALLQCADNASVVEYGISAWRARLMKRPPDTILKMLEDALCQSSRRRKAADRFRLELASESLAIRLRALVMLEKLGNLDDINLLMDLLCLPPQDGESPAEREAILKTMSELAGFSGWDPSSAVKPLHPGGSSMPAASVTSSMTLYDDWLRRRKRLTSYSGPRRAYVEPERRVLDFLIQNYADSPLAQRPACFPMPGEVFMDRRAIVVFHHLGKSEVVGVKTEQEASKRASLILRRMSSMNLQAEAKNFTEVGRVRTDAEPAQNSGAAKPVSAAQLELWERIEEELTIRGPKVHCNLLYKKMEESLGMGPTLPDKAVYYLSCQIANPDAVELLSRCDNKGALEYAFGIWRRRVVRPVAVKPRPRFVPEPVAGMTLLAASQDTALETPIPVVPSPSKAIKGVSLSQSTARRRLGPSRLVNFFCCPQWRERAAEKFRRELLAAECAKVRIEAVRVLGRTGSLDDISLLSDLLSLPRVPDEDPRERHAMLQAMQRLTRAWLPGQGNGK